MLRKKQSRATRKRVASRQQHARLLLNTSMLATTHAVTNAYQGRIHETNVPIGFDTSSFVFHEVRVTIQPHSNAVLAALSDEYPP